MQTVDQFCLQINMMNLLRYTAQGADEDIQLTDAPHHQGKIANIF